MTRSEKAALYYAGRGWSVIPLHIPENGKCSCTNSECTSIGKHPRTFNGLSNASSDKDQIKTWWSKWPTTNIGILTGASSGVVVLDIDGAAGFKSIENLEIPETPTVKTGKGRHIYFQHPGDVEMRNFTGRLPGVDFRGDGGYVVSAPSVHVSGHVYEWETPPWRLKPAPCPQWLIDLAKKKEVDIPTDSMATDKSKIPSGQRNAELTRVAGTLRNKGMSAVEILPSLIVVNNERCVPPLSDREVKLIVASIARYDPSSSIGKPEPVRNGKPDIVGLMEKRLADIKAGKFRCIDWPWPMFSKLTKALMPGKLTMIIGSPGASKSFSLLQSCSNWIKNGDNPSIFAYEDEIEFHTTRLLAQISGKSWFTDPDWVKEHPEGFEQALVDYKDQMIQFNEHWHMANNEDSQDDLILWMEREAKAGRRVLGIDPITMAEQSGEVWVADKEFVKNALKILTKYGPSLVLVTHPQKGQKAESEYMAGGVAYRNFSATIIGIKRHDLKTSPVKRFLGYEDYTPIEYLEHNATFELSKTRNGRGNGMKMAFMFHPSSLTFNELGIICKAPPTSKTLNIPMRKDWQ